MKAYKGFNKDMTCKGFQYEEGKEYTHVGPVKACYSGFHACEDPIDCFRYYAPAESVFHEVEQSGEISKGGDDSKIASSIIKVGGRIDFLGIAKAHFEYVKAHTNLENTDPKQASAGYYGAATAGFRGAATSRGSSSVGKEGIACARGNNVKAKGGLGAVLVIVEENSNDYGIKAWNAGVVDGNRIKENTFYKLVNGEFFECCDEGETNDTD